MIEGKERTQLSTQVDFLTLSAAWIAVISSRTIGLYSLAAMFALGCILILCLFATLSRQPRTISIPFSARFWNILGIGTLLLVNQIFDSYPNIPIRIIHASICIGLIGILRFLRTTLVVDRFPALTFAALIVSSQAPIWAVVAYPDLDSWSYPFLPWISLFLFISMGLAVCSPLERLRDNWRWFLILFLVLGGMIRWVGVVASPDPVIDVWAWRKEAPQYLLKGINPYGAEYQNVYGTERANKYGFSSSDPPTTRTLPTYPPLPIYLSLPFSAAKLDVRYADILCDLLAASMIAIAGYATNRKLVGLIAAGIYLSFPRAAWIVEQSWYETMLAGMFGLGFVLLKYGYRIGGLVLGLGLTGKQFGAILTPTCLMACRQSWKALLLGILVAFLITAGVFLIWDSSWFLDIILFSHLQLSPRLDSLTWMSFFYQEFGIQIPGGIMLLLMVLLLVLVTIRVPSCPISGAAFVGVGLLLFSLFHTQGNLNYYYLCTYLLLLGTAGLSSLNGEPEIESAIVGLPNQIHHD